jgi:protein SCO1
MEIVLTSPRRAGRGRGGTALFLGIVALAASGCGRGAGPAKPSATSSEHSTKATGPDGAKRPNASARPVPDGPAPRPEKPGPVETVDYPLTGIVRSVSPESGRVLIHHREIPGFMKAMTMPFEPAEPAVLGLLHKGDEVEGILHVEKQDGAVRDYKLKDLKVTKPAPAKTLVLDVSKGKALLREKPALLQVGEPVPDFVMTGQDGKPFKLSELRGKVIALTFIYTRCPMPEFCPLMDRKFSDLAQHLGAFPNRSKDIRLISLSFDAEHDTPEVLRKHAAMRGAVPPLWSYAVATHEELAKIDSRLGLFFGPDGQEIAHNLCTAIIGPDGKLARVEVGRKPNAWGTAEMLKTIYPLLPGGAK